jgi:hypothetical protein
MGQGGALEHEDAVGDRFEVEEGSVGGLQVLSMVTHLGRGEPMMRSWTSDHQRWLIVQGGTWYQGDARDAEPVANGARLWSKWVDDDEPLAEGEAAGAGTSRVMQPASRCGGGSIA